jgi:hypothetical protein
MESWMDLQDGVEVEVEVEEPDDSPRTSVSGGLPNEATGWEGQEADVVGTADAEAVEETMEASAESGEFEPQTLEEGMEAESPFHLRGAVPAGSHGTHVTMPWTSLQQISDFAASWVREVREGSLGSLALRMKIAIIWWY